MSLHVYEELEQGSDAWVQARAGIVTASTVGQLITAKTAKPAENDTSRALTATLAAERITGHVEEVGQSRDMLRGTLSEPYARDIYAEHYAPVSELGFMVRDEWGFRIGYSPDGLVGDDGLIEIKSPRAKAHVQTLIRDEVPPMYMAQLQAGLLVSGRDWIDFVSYTPGHPLYVHRVEPLHVWQKAIVEAATIFEENVADLIAAYQAASEGRPPTEHVDVFEEEDVILL